MVPLETPRPSSKQKRATKDDNSALAKAAKVAKVSKHKLRAAIAVRKSGDEKVIKEVKAGTKSLNEATKEIQPKKAKTSEPYDLVKDVTSRWTRWLDNFAVCDRAEVRAIVLQLIENEDKKFSKA